MILAGDIGGTRARLALYEADGKGRPVKAAVLESGSYRSLEDVVRTFLGNRKLKIQAATFGIAGPVIGQRAVTTNLPWVVDARVLMQKLGIPRVVLLNDLVALAFGALTVSRAKLQLLHGGGAPKKKGATISVIAAGTGLGEAALVWDGVRFVALPTEGGHTDFAARSPLEFELFEYLEKRFGHVSYERIVSGPGFATLYEFFRDAKGMTESRDNIEQLDASHDKNAAIASLGVAGTSEIARRAVDLFVGVYGAEAGNLALKTLSTGGVYVAGNIAAHLGEYMARGGFLDAFFNKGRFRKVLEQIPVAIVLDSTIGLAGARYHAAQMVASSG